ALASPPTCFSRTRPCAASTSTGGTPWRPRCSGCCSSRCPPRPAGCPLPVLPRCPAAGRAPSWVGGAGARAPARPPAPPRRPPARAREHRAPPSTQPRAMSASIAPRARIDRPLQGIGFIVVGASVFPVQDVLIKGLSSGYPVLQIVFVRSLVALGLFAVLIWR